MLPVHAHKPRYSAGLGQGHAWTGAGQKDTLPCAPLPPRCQELREFCGLSPGAQSPQAQASSSGADSAQTQCLSRLLPASSVRGNDKRSGEEHEQA